MPPHILLSRRSLLIRAVSVPAVAGIITGALAAVVLPAGRSPR